MVTIPTHPNYRKNADRCKDDVYPCVVCGKPCPDPRYMVHLWWGTTVVTEDEAATMDPSGDMYMYPIGSDCLRKHPELQPYAHKQSRAVS